MRLRLTLAILAIAVSAPFAHAQTSPIIHPLVPAVTPTPAQILPLHSHAIVSHKSYSRNAPLSQTLYNHGTPTNEEQEELELINRARANPPAEGKRLDTATDFGVEVSLGNGETPTRSEIQTDFQSYGTVPPLAFNPDLIASALSHSNDMLSHGYQGHTGSDGSTDVDRMTAAGYPAATNLTGENVDDYGTDAWDIMASFEYDFGNNPPGHRENLINYTNYVFAEIGVGTIDGSNAGLGPQFTTEDFADDGNRFILGVVYDDKNGNGFYDEGEGLAGVTIKPASGNYYAVTSSSGGYAILYSGSGSVTVTASGGALQSPISKTISFGSDNVKVDFTTQETGIPGVVNLLLPEIDGMLSTDTADFTWNKITGATSYHLQVSLDSLMKTFIVNDSVLTDTSKLLAGLSDGNVYYWRVRAKNAKGWGDFSAVQAFDVMVPPMLVSPMNGAVLNSDITFYWRRGSALVNDYWFLLSLNKNMSNLTWNDSSLALYDTSEFLPYSTLLPDTTYYWTVLTQSEGGSPWGTSPNVWSFKTASLSSVPVQLAPAALSASVYPNPTFGQTHIRFTLPKSIEVSLKIYNALGQEITTLVTGKLSAKAYDVAWDASALASGVYIYKFQTETGTSIGRIVLAR